MYVSHGGKTSTSSYSSVFEEDNDSVDHSGVCCNVCGTYKMIDFQDYKEEITVILEVVQDIPEKGKTKVQNKMLHVTKNFQVHKYKCVLLF